MNRTILIGFIIIVVTAVTGGLVHSATLHDNNVCEVCLHVQSHGDININEVPTIVIPDQKISYKLGRSASYQLSIIDGTSIRGPPQFC